MRTKKIVLTTTRRKRGFLGIMRTVTEKKTVEVPVPLYKKLKAQEKKKSKYRPYTLEEMMFYDDIFGD